MMIKSRRMIMSVFLSAVILSGCSAGPIKILEKEPVSSEQGEDVPTKVFSGVTFKPEGRTYYAREKGYALSEPVKGADQVLLYDKGSMIESIGVSTDDSYIMVGTLEKPLFVSKSLLSDEKVEEDRTASKAGDEEKSTASEEISESQSTTSEEDINKVKPDIPETDTTEGTTTPKTVPDKIKEEEKTTEKEVKDNKTSESTEEERTESEKTTTEKETTVEAETTEEVTETEKETLTEKETSAPITTMPLTTSKETTKPSGREDDNSVGFTPVITKPIEDNENKVNVATVPVRTQAVRTKTQVESEDKILYPATPGEVTVEQDISIALVNIPAETIATTKIVDSIDKTSPLQIDVLNGLTEVTVIGIGTNGMLKITYGKGLIGYVENIYISRKIGENRTPPLKNKVVPATVPGGGN